MQSSSNADSAIIARIQEGMHVIDASGNDVGKVEYVQIGDPEAVTTQGSGPGPEGLAGHIADTVLDDRPEPDVPGTLRASLLRTGFLKIDGRGLFASNRYVSMERVRDVSGDVVRLDVRKEELATESHD